MAVGPALSFQTGISGTGMNALSPLLKEWMEPVLNEKLQNRQVTLFRILGPKGRKKVKFTGQRLYGAAITAWPESIDTRLEGVFLPFPYGSTGINPVMYNKKQQGRLRFTGDVERATQDDKGAWAKAVSIEVRNFGYRFAEKLEHKLIVGNKGILGQIETDIDTTSTTAMVMLSAAGRTHNAPWRFGTQFLRPNQELRVVATIGGNPTVANTAGQSDFRMSSTASGFTWTTTAATLNAKTASDHITGTSQFLVGHNTRPDTGNAETSDQTVSAPTGLMEIVDSSTATTNLYTTLYGLTRSSNTVMNAIVSEANGVVRDLSEALISTALDRAKNEGPGGDQSVDCMIAHDSIRFRYANLLTATRQFMSTDGKNVVQSAGFKDELAYVGGGEPIPFVTSKDFPPGTIFGIVKSNFSWYYQTEPGFITTDGQSRRFIPDYDQTEVVYHLDGNLWCEAPNANFKIDDLRFNTTDYAAA